MAAKLHRLRSNPEKLRHDQATQLREALRPFQAAMPDAVRSLTAHIDAQTAALNRWTFLMLSPEQNHAVVRWLNANSRRPMRAMSLWSLLFTSLDRETGEVLMTRDELAEALEIAGQDVSEIMSELETCGAVSRRRERVAGMRGPGRVRYFLNPIVGTHLAGRARDQAQAEAPPIRAAAFTVTRGGKA